MSDLGTLMDVELTHRIYGSPEHDRYSCAKCGLLRPARPGEPVREPASEHCRQHGLCGACWGAGMWYFPSSPICKEPRCTQCAGAGTAEAEADPSITWTNPTTAAFAGSSR